ncbi:MAG: hypothetical protein D9N13_14125 [Ketobacter sp. GenoA1]|nr:MAG: hypothetical protein D9N13_14125 [Ketobacter sp. GenoA1]
MLRRGFVFMALNRLFLHFHALKNWVHQWGLKSSEMLLQVWFLSCAPIQVVNFVQIIANFKMFCWVSMSKHITSASSIVPAFGLHWTALRGKK